ncbi:MAG TPA: HAMP domain-containing sensor histidine kinase [Thermodesulfovibrionales bacterium]|nr:HAMP domain-containing sensor histidine kinase [Thermodesulfovibrionales bacterium]
MELNIPSISFDDVMSVKGLVKGLEQLREIGPASLEPSSETNRNGAVCMFIHDMKNPVMTAGTSVSRLLSEKMGSLTDRQKDYLGLVKNSLSKLETLLTQFMDFLKIDSRECKPVFHSIDMASAVSRNIDGMKINAEKKRLNISFDCPELMAPVSADLMMINRIITNLLDNAIKYTDPGGKISVKVSETDDSVAVRIMDTGAGIPPQHLSRIFEPFYRGQNDSEGSGLGLSIVKTMVEAHGGGIWVESIPEKGSSFIFTLPKRKQGHA